MPEETKRLEPEPVETYRCPVCDKKLECSLEEARKHVNQPVDNGLPMALIYEDNTSKTTPVREFHLILVHPEGCVLDMAHGPVQSEYMFFSSKPNKIDGKGIFVAVNSTYVKDKLRSGEYKLVRLEDLRRHFGSDLKPLEKHLHEYVLRMRSTELVDPTPELEALVAERVRLPKEEREYLENLKARIPPGQASPL